MHSLRQYLRLTKLVSGSSRRLPCLYNNCSSSSSPSLSLHTISTRWCSSSSSSSSTVTPSPSSVIDKASLLSNFVYRMRMLDYYAQNDAAVAHEFTRSNFIVMLDRRPLVLFAPPPGGARLVSLHFEDLSRRLSEWGFSIDLVNSVFLDLDDVIENGVKAHRGLFGVSIRTAELPEDSPISIDKIRDDVGQSLGGRFMDLRRAMLSLDQERDRNLLAKHHTLSRWSAIYRRCPKCASALRQRVSKTAAECLQCQRFYYPTLSPVAITLVRDAADEHALLVRHKGSVPGVYTCVAGFAVAGESLEQTVQRELAEEVGLDCFTVPTAMGRSQPWPMPDSSLMSAFEVVADKTQMIQVCPDELETARWFTRNEVASAVERTINDPLLKKLPRNPDDRQKFLYIPPAGAIAHQMIKGWLHR